MLFSSLEFLFFFLPVVFCLYAIIKKRYQNYLLLLVSLFFYAWGEPRFVLVMMGVILADYLFARGIAWSRGRGENGKIWVVLAVLSNIGILFVYKYLNFFTANLSLLTGGRVGVTSIALPIGISFFIFQALSYVVDVYRRDTEAQRNPFYLGLYVSFFPQLIAGPIVRYTTVEKEIENRSVTIEGFAGGAERFIIGLCKKVILANTFAVIADEAFPLAGTPGLSVGFAWMGILAYTFQIFFDFSGYSDMAIGMGRMFGFHFLENFNYPYISRSISEFWRRWHISLGTWFRDYVYFPLGGSRVKSKGRLVWNLFVVWLLTGLWHGANWTFVVWGLLYFVLITWEKLSGYPDRFKTAVPRAFYQLIAMGCVMAGWVVFRSDDMPSALLYFKSLFGAAGNPVADGTALFYLRENLVFFLAAFLCSAPFFPWLGGKLTSVRALRGAVSVLRIPLYLGLFLLSVSYLVVGGHNPFIYFNF